MTWDDCLKVAAEWERKGWLIKYFKGNEEYWQLTPLGRRELKLPTLQEGSNGRLGQN